MQTATKSIMALDVGTSRIGVALSSLEVRLAQPLTTLQAASALTDLANIIEEHKVVSIVVGWPRGLAGQVTAQTQITQAFIGSLTQRFNMPIYKQDEAVTSHQAEAELKTRAKPYERGEIDALAATYILEDFLLDNPPEGLNV